MSVVDSLNRKGLAGLLVVMALAGLFASVPRVTAVPTGAYFDHVVIIAMENQHYSSVLGSGTLSSCPVGTAPFLCSMLPLSSTVPHYHSYCSGSSDPACGSISGCSAACYVAILSGSTYGVSDGYGCCLSGTTFVDQMASAGLTWQAYCAEGCPRGNDHFAFTGFSSDHGSPNVYTSSSVTTSTFIAAANSAAPPNLLWYTPTDQENMHSVSVGTGDSYLKNFLVGSGSLASPASGSLLASNVFTNPSYRTLLWIWWDEYDPSPNIEYGPLAGVKLGYVSSSNSWDEYSQLRMMEDNWGLGTLQNSGKASVLNDIFGAGNNGGTSALSSSISINPTVPAINSSVTFTGSVTGGTGPYTYSWSFGDGTTATGATATHTYSKAGSYMVTMKATDSTGKATTTTQQVSVGQTSPPGQLPSLTPTIAFLIIGLILGGAASTVMYLARYHAHNQRLREATG